MDTTAAEQELPDAIQRRNGYVFLVNTALTYLVAPVFYVGVLHAAILDNYGANDAVANLPEAVYLWTTPLAIVVAWIWPAPHLLKPMLASAHVAQALAGLAIAVLFVAAPRSWLVPGLVAHAGIIGIAIGVRNMCIWELLGRGVSRERRGWTLGWSFGLGPIFAVLGSCASQLVLSGEFLGLIRISPVPAPWSYVILFGATTPTMLFAGILVAGAQLPPIEAAASQRVSASGIVQGLRQYFLNPLIAITAIGFLLTYGGTMIMVNVALYVRPLLNAAPEDYAGIQLALRFGCKCIAGFGLGWLVARVHAKASLLVTTAICLAGVAWALWVPGELYLLSFGLLGAGELFYVYYVNYIVGCSAPERIRENTAYTNVITAAVGFFPVVFGMVSEREGYPASFLVAMAVFAAAMLLVAVGLPREPRQARSSSDS